MTDILEVLKKKPYSFKTRGKLQSSHTLLFDGAQITTFYIRLDEMYRIVNLLNAAYAEGYMQKELEIAS